MSSNILALLIFSVCTVHLGTCYSLADLLRIVRGQKTTIDKHPYMVSIGKVVSLGKLKWNDPHFCGASLITPKCVLSAAHCFEDEKKEWLLVHAGRTRTFDVSETRGVVDIIMPQEQISGSVFLDVAILKLNASLHGKNIDSIELDLEEQLRAGDVVQVAGWGQTEEYMAAPRNMDETEGDSEEESTVSPPTTTEKNPSPDDSLEIVKDGKSLTVAARWQRAQPARTHLHDISVSVVDQKTCQRTMTELGEPPVTKNMFCAFGENKEDACDGDSGGPVVRDGKQVGIVSWGSGCGYYPGVYTRLNARRVAEFVRKTVHERCL